jgi:hypothetical protein
MAPAAGHRRQQTAGGAFVARGRPSGSDEETWNEANARLPCSAANARFLGPANSSDRTRAPLTASAPPGRAVTRTRNSHIRRRSADVPPENSCAEPGGRTTALPQCSCKALHPRGIRGSVAGREKPVAGHGWCFPAAGAGDHRTVAPDGKTTAPGVCASGVARIRPAGPCCSVPPPRRRATETWSPMRPGWPWTRTGTRCRPLRDAAFPRRGADLCLRHPSCCLFAARQVLEAS